jgi:hypothetical protein
VFENRVLRRIFGPKRDEVTGEWRKLHNEEVRDLYSSSSIIRIIKSRRMRWAGHVARMGEKTNAYRLLVGKPKEKRPLGRPRRRWVDNIRMDLGEVSLTYSIYEYVRGGPDCWLGDSSAPLGHDNAARAVTVHVCVTSLILVCVIIRTLQLRQTR